MAVLRVVLEDENGKELASFQEGGVARALPKQFDPRFPWASTIDPYGDTTLNRRQAELLRKEWAILIREAEDAIGRHALMRVDELLLRCVSDVHLYVKFYGD